MKIFFENFTCVEDVIREFCLSEDALEGIEIIYAIYNTADYEGDAHIIFIRNGKLYEVNDSHCSCNGLENWEPEETSFAALMFRPNVSSDAKSILKMRYPNLVCFL